MPTKYVCADCVDDTDVKEFIESEAEERTCSYCKRTVDNEDDDPIAADFDSVAGFICEAIEAEYESPDENVAFCSAEGGFVGIEPMDASDLLSEVGLDSCNQQFLEDLADELREHDWVRRDPYGLPEDEALADSWETFANQVKHVTRFVFFKVATTRNQNSDPEPHLILEEIGKIVTRLGLLQTLPEGVEVIRARQHSVTVAPTTAATLGAPPQEFSSQSRMSPAGIPMFYGAEDEAVAFAEIFSNDSSKPHITFARFRTLRTLTLLDLTSIPAVPSLFDTDAAHTRMALSFMHNFEANATAPVPHDESQHYRYVPTQVVAEYFRHVFTLNDGARVDGIIFNSSKGRAGKCYTLFVDSGQCTDSATDPDKTLVLTAYRKATIDFANQTYS